MAGEEPVSEEIEEPDWALVFIYPLIQSTRVKLLFERFGNFKITIITESFIPLFELR